MIEEKKVKKEKKRLYVCGACDKINVIAHRPSAGTKSDCTNCGDGIWLTSTRLFNPVRDRALIDMEINADVAADIGEFIAKKAAGKKDSKLRKQISKLIAKIGGDQARNAAVAEKISSLIAELAATREAEAKAKAP